MLIVCLSFIIEYNIDALVWCNNSIIIEYVS